jgi:hypothetical protein
MENRERIFLVLQIYILRYHTFQAGISPLIDFPFLQSIRSALILIA